MVVLVGGDSVFLIDGGRSCISWSLVGYVDILFFFVMFLGEKKCVV